MSSYSYKKEKKSSLKWAFAKAAVIVAAGYASYEQYIPEDVKDATETGLVNFFSEEKTVQAVNPDQLKLTFESGSYAKSLDPNSEIVSFTPINTVNEWYACMGRQQLLMMNEKNKEQFHLWLSQLNHLRGKSIEEKCKGVDALIDAQITYATESDTYGKDEYFASPIETLMKGKGDCDDFAILKYYALRYLGVPAEKMFVTAVKPKGSDEIVHCTLMIDTRNPGILQRAWESIAGASDPTIIIIDNDETEMGRLIEARDSGVKPCIAMNEKGVWNIPSNSKFSW